VSSDEYLNYAIMNRNEWEKKGRDIIAGYAKKYGNSATEETYWTGKNGIAVPEEKDSILDESSLVVVKQP